MSRAALLIATRNAHKAREIRQVLTGDFQFLTLHDFPAAPDVVEDGATFAANASKKAAALADWLLANGPAASLPSSNSSNLNPNPDPDPNLSTFAPFYVLADDSGLEVDDLGGSPGVHSARFAALDTGLAGNSPDAANNAKLLRLLAKAPLPRRAARFRCVLALKKLPETWMAGRAVHCPPSGIVGGTSAAPLSRGGQSRLVGSPTGLESSDVSMESHPAFPGSETTLFEGVCPGHISLQPTGAGGFGYDPLFIPDGFDKSFAELGDAVKNAISHRALALQKLRQYLASPPAAAP